MSPLLTLTDNAAEVVRQIVTASDEVSDGGGLRMVAQHVGVDTGLEVSIALLPAEDDEVIEEQGARVFLDPQAALFLDDKILDANVEQNGIAFTIADQIQD